MTAKQVITPTVGRKVWYRPSAADLEGPTPMSVVKGQPLDATVIAVWGDRMVNLLVVDSSGHLFPVLSCGLKQPGDAVEPGKDGKPAGRYCEWMPYQQSAAKVEPMLAASQTSVAEPISRIYAPHQLRVIEERDELEKKVIALEKFTLGQVFSGLEQAEKSRLNRQLDHMQDYMHVLAERIAAF